MEGSTKYWNEWLSLIQENINNNIHSRTKSTPHSLMFNRANNGLENFRDVEINPNIPVLQVLQKSNTIHKDVIIPAISLRSRRVTKVRRNRLDRDHKIIEELKPGTIVYAIDKTKVSKWDPNYEGPFSVVRRNKGGSYILKDKTGDELKRRFTVDMLKLAKETTKGGKEDKHYDVERILSDKMIDGAVHYLVKWKGYNNKSNTWQTVRDFDDLNTVKKYWKMKNGGKGSRRY